MNQKLSVLVVLVLLVFPLKVLGQRPGKGGKMPRGNANGQGAAANMGLGGNQAMMGGQQQGGRQNMPSVDQLAQMMLASFDADGSGALDQAELKNALTGLRAMMMQNRGQGGQMGIAGQQNAQLNQMGARRGAFNNRGGAQQRAAINWNAAGQRPVNGGQQGRRGAGRKR